MSEKVNKAIEVTYQAAGVTTGLEDVTMVIYDETHSLDAVNFADVVLTEIGATGRYYGSFTPDAEGKWTIMIDSITAPGKIVKKYDVGASDIDSVSENVTTVDGKIVTVDGKIDALNDIAAADVTGGTTVAAAVTAITGGSETLETIKTAVDAISVVTPPMVG